MPTRYLLVVVLAPLLAGATADVSRFRPPAEPTELLGVETATVLQPMQFTVGATLSYAHNPIVWRYDDGTYDPLIDQQLMLDLAGAIGIYKLVDVGVVLPVALMHAGPSDNAVGIDPNGGSLSGAGLGDLRLIPRVALIQERRAGFGLALASELTFPTGDASRFLGDPGVTWRPRLLASQPFRRAPVPLRVSASLGYRLRENGAAADVSFADEIEMHAGLEAEVVKGALPVSTLLEVTGATAATRPFDGRGMAGAEVLAGLRVRFLDAFLITAAGGAGLTSGVGTPDFRVIFGVAYSPVPPDRDGDGIYDYADDCPDVPEDDDGFEDLDGCPDKDNDNDGIPDLEDLCPNEPEDMNGVRDEDGCPDHGVRDRDEDGILDDDDLCPDEAEDLDGFEDTDGCPDPDNDHDGVPDKDDKCPSEKETINGVDDWDGCPDEGEGVTEYIENVKIQIKATILFESGKAAIKEESKPILDQVALQILAHPDIKKVRVEGHTDSMGPEDDNLYLSQDRADSVRRYLITRGVAKEKLEAVGYGETRPIDTNDTTAGRTKNRRVDFVIVNR